MTALTGSDYFAIAGLLAGFVGLPGALIVMSLKNVRGDMAKMDARLSVVEQEKVSHAEWVRVTVSHNNRMERVCEQLAELSGKMDANFGIPRGLSRIADALEGRAESDT